MSYRAGETVVIRDVHEGAIFCAWPLHVLEDGASGLITVQVPGAIGKVVKGYPSDRSRFLSEVASGKPTLVDKAWSSVSRVGVITPATWWCTWLMWDATTGDFLRYYVDFLRPVVRRRHLLDTLDLGLDVVVVPDGTWSWKDLDDVALLQERGWLGQEIWPTSNGPRLKSWAPWKAAVSPSTGAFSPGGQTSLLALPPCPEIGTNFPDCTVQECGGGGGLRPGPPFPHTVVGLTWDRCVLCTELRGEFLRVPPSRAVAL